MKHRLFLCLILIFLLPIVAQADTKKIEGTTNIEDTYAYSTYPDDNYGTSADIKCGGSYRGLIRVKNVASELGVGATITGCVCSLFVNYEWNYTVSMYRMFKPWVEGVNASGECLDTDGGVTWNDWDCDALEWGTAGWECANDDGVDNSQDGTCDASGRDRKSTAEVSVVCETDEHWEAFVIPNAIAQGWYDKTIEEEGLAILATGATTFNSTEAASNQPFFVFTYTTNGEPPEKKARRRPIIIKGD